MYGLPTVADTQQLIQIIRFGWHAFSNVDHIMPSADHKLNYTNDICLLPRKAGKHTKISCIACPSCLSWSDALALRTNCCRYVQQILQYMRARPGSGCSNYLTASTGPNCCLGPSSINLFLQHTPQRNLPTMGLDTTISLLLCTTWKTFRKTVPLFLSYGGREPLSNVFDVKYLLDNLRDHDKDKLVAQYTAEYAHIVIWIFLWLRMPTKL
ncbi:hypothetical protein ACFX1Q_025039 [Malus domestica]